MTPDDERIRFAQTIRLVLASFPGERLVAHVRDIYALDAALVVVTRADGGPAFTVGRGVARHAGPAPFRIDSLALRWERPRCFAFSPRSRHALIAWLESEVEQHNQEVEK